MYRFIIQISPVSSADGTIIPLVLGHTLLQCNIHWGEFRAVSAVLAFLFYQVLITAGLAEAVWSEKFA